MKKIHFVFDLGGSILDSNVPHFHQLDPDEFLAIGLEIPKGIAAVQTIIERLFSENAKESTEVQIPSLSIIDNAIKEFELKTTAHDLIELSWKLLGGSACNYILPLPGAKELLRNMKKK